MRFLLDENVPKDAAVALRSEGHDVVWIVETALRGAADDVVVDAVRALGEDLSGALVVVSPGRVRRRRF